MSNRDLVYAFIAGVLIGLYLSDLIAIMQHRETLNALPTFDQKEGEK